MEQPGGPGSGFECLVDVESREGLDLPDAFQRVYGGWIVPDGAGRPYTYVNFVTSRDGRVSFNVPGKSSGGPISGNSRHDRWLMGLLRARADAVLVGASALEGAPRQTWNAAAIFPDDRVAWEGLRGAEGRAPAPLHVVVTRSGRVRNESPVLQDAAVPTLIVSTDTGIERARGEQRNAPNVQFFSTGERLDFQALLRELGATYGARTVLSEAGPRVYGALLAAGVVDDEFLTLSPIVAGNTAEAARPGLVEGVAFDPDTPPRSRLVALYRSADYLFLHSRYA